MVMFDLRFLPHLLHRAGVSEFSNVLLNWDTDINIEIRRRSSSASMSKKRSHDQLSASGSSGSSGRAASSILRRPIGSTDSLGSDSLDGSTTESAHDQQQQRRFELLELSKPPIHITWPQSQSHQQQHQQEGVMVMVQAHVPDPGATCTMDESQHRDLLESMTKPDLVAYAARQFGTLSKQQKTIDTLRHQVKMEKQRVRRLTQRVTDRNDQLTTFKNPELTDLDVFRGNAKKLSWRGSISLGLRKGMAFVSAASFPMSSMLDIARQTVVRCEVLVCAYIMVRSIAFHRITGLLLKRLAQFQSSDDVPPGHHQQMGDGQTMSLSLVQSDTDGAGVLGHWVPSHTNAMCNDLGLPLVETVFSANTPMTSSGDSTSLFCLGCTFFSGDATNSAIWKRQKLQGLMASSGLMTDWNALRNGNCRAAFKTTSWVCLD